MTALTVAGVDPGARETGLVLRRGDQMLAHLVVPEAGRGMARYLGVVLDALVYWSDLDLVAVEGVTAPSPHLRLTNPAPLLDAALLAGGVVGAALAREVDVVLVPPGGHGAGVLTYYPAALVSDGERRHGLARAGGSSPLRHCRSAWDVAGAGERLRRAQARAGT